MNELNLLLILCKQHQTYLDIYFLPQVWLISFRLWVTIWMWIIINISTPWLNNLKVVNIFCQYLWEFRMQQWKHKSNETFSFDDCLINQHTTSPYFYINYPIIWINFMLITEYLSMCSWYSKARSYRIFQGKF